MSRLIKVGEAANILGVTIQTLRRWESTGQLLPDKKTEGGTRYYNIDRLLGVSKKEVNLTYAYARVSSHDQKKELDTQKELLATYCIARGWNYEVISDLGSGMNYRKKGLKNLLDAIIKGKIKRLVLTHKDRLLRFGAELVFTLCEIHHVEIVIINQGEDLSFEEELAQDVLEIITVFSARMYGARSRKNLKLVEAAKELMK
ncbi:MAG: IS607 family transposase [Chlamydiota bacterium]